MSEDVNVIALVKGTERYVFLWTDADRQEVLRTLGRFAENYELSFDWMDVASLTQKVRGDATC